MKIRTQFMISTIVLGSLLLLVSASEIITNQWVQKIREQVELAAQIEREAYELGYLANDYLLYRESQQANRWESKFSSFSNNLSNMDVNTPELWALLANIKSNQQRLKAVFTEVRTSIESAPQTQQAVFDANFMQVSWSRLEVQSQGLIFDAARLEGLLREQENRLQRVTSLLSFVLIGILGAFLWGSYGLVFRRTLQSVAELQAGTSIIGSGDLDFAIAVKKEDEIGELSHAFNQMAANLKHVTASKADLEREITERNRAEEMLRNTNERLQDQAEELAAQSEELRLQTHELALANEQLRESEARFRGFYESGLLGVIFWNMEGEIIDANNKFLEIVGYNRQDLAAGRIDWINMTPPEHGHLDEASVHELRATGVNKNPFEKEFIRKDGSRVPILIASSMLDEARFNGVAFVLDITERKQAEQRIAAHTSEIQAANIELNSARLAALNLIEDTLRAQKELQKVNAMLRESEQHLNRAQEIAHLGSWELDLIDNQLSWSDEVYRIFGLQPQEFGATYEAFLDAVHPDDRTAVDAAYSSSIREGRDSYEIEHRVVKRSSGEIRFVHEKCEHFRNEAGQITRSIGMVHDVTERVQAEQALRESEEKYRNLFENMTEEVHFWQLVRDKTGCIKTWQLVDANPPTLKSWGRSSVEEIKGKTCDEIFGPGATDHYMPVVQKIITESTPYSYEDYFPNLDKHFRFTSVPLGEHFITTGADITGLKKAHEALRLARDELELRVQERTNELAVANQELLYEIYEREEVERQLRIQTTAMEAAANGIVITNPEGEIMWTNPALSRMTGYAEDELAGQTMRLFRSGQHDADYYRRMWATILAGEVWHGETTNRRKDGSLYIEEQTITPVHDENNQISHFIAIKQDITEHKQIEAALELERTRLKNILDTIPDGVYIINQHYDIEYTNPVIEREFGAVDGRKCFSYFHDLVEPCPWCANDEVFAGSSLTREYTYLKNNKSYEIFDAPLVNSDGGVSKLKLLHDITRRKKMELDIEQSNRDLQATSAEERKQRQLAEALVAAALVLNKSLELDEVLKIILEQIRLAIPYQFADVGLLEGDAFYDASHQGEANLPATQAGTMGRYLLSDFPLLKNMCESGQPVLIPDTDQEPDWKSIEGFAWCRSFLSAPLIVEKQVIGFMNLFAREPSFYTGEMCDRLVAFASHAAAAIQNAWLFEQLRASSERLQSLSRRLVEVQEAERLYIARELHDEAGQMLTSLMLDLRLLEKKASQPEAILNKVSEMEGSLNAVIENLHNVAMALRPASLDHLGLVSALRQHVGSIGEKYGLEAHFRSKGILKRLQPNVETVLYRIVQEALTNVVRHAQASQVDVVLTVRQDKLLVIIEDNGNGFNPEEVPAEGHLGLFGMRERVEMIDGKLVIESTPGEGTTIIVEVNYDDPVIDRG